MTTIGPHLLGRNVEHDPQNWDYRHPVRRAVKLVNVLHTLNAPCLDQGDIGSCEGNTAAEFLNTSKAIRNRRALLPSTPPNAPVTQRRFERETRHGYLTEDAAVTLYATATELDDDNVPEHFPPVDTGTTAEGIAKAMKLYGAIDAYQWSFDEDQFLAVGQKQPIMVGTNWYSGMFDPDSKGFVQPSATDENPDGGHAYLYLGTNVREQYFVFQNHWNVDWGVKFGGGYGRFKMRFPVFFRLLREQGEAMIPVLK